VNQPEAFTPHFNNFFYAANTTFGAFLAESADLLESRPDLVAAIEHDLDQHGLNKKELREADREFDLNRTLPLPEIDEAGKSHAPAEKESPGKLEYLETGRPRFPAVAVGILLLTRGYTGSCTNQESRDFVGESKSLDAWLMTRNLTLPARSTVSELLNAVTQETRDKILAATLYRAYQEKLDDFDRCVVDSTASRANSSWPTDAKTIFSLCSRLWNIGSKLEPFNLKNIRPGRMENWLGTLGKIPFQINLNVRNQKKFRKLCREFIDLSSKIIWHAHKEYKRLEKEWKEAAENLPPSIRVQLLERIANYLESLHLASKSIEQMRQRIFENKTFPSTKRVLSVHDESAAFIQKGGREPVIGYKPQLARSGNGFVTALLVEEGNIADSTHLIPVVETTIANTGIIPQMVSTDDGYSSAKNLEATECLGVKDLSISGSKGKKLLAEKWEQDEYRQARKDRSAVESLIFCLKHSFDFGQLSRTGLKAVRQELTEKCLAYNICRLVYLRKRKPQCQEAAA